MVALHESIEDFDLCKCGDYRHQHEDGAGRCMISWSESHIGICKSFRLFTKATEIPEVYKRYLANANKPKS